MASNKWVKPKTKPPKAPPMTTAKLAAKQGYKPPGIGEQMVMALMKPMLADALAGKPVDGQKLGKKPKAAPLKKPVKDVKELAAVSSAEAAAYADGKGKKSAKVQGVDNILGMAAAKNSLKGAKGPPGTGF